MKTISHKAETRGHANHGWLDTRHTFSFAHYYNPERVHFGALRVLNDDIVAGGGGFGTHPHDNMEIISIPLRGDLEHKDSMGNVAVIRQHDVQIMSAGTGIYHSEKNKNHDQDVNFLQIWVFPNKQNVTPRYDQRTYKPEDRINRLQVVVSPDGLEGVQIHQNAWFSLGTLESGKELTYKLHDPQNGVYVFMIDGTAEVAGTSLNRRDGLGITEAPEFNLKALSSTEVLLMEVPVKL